jgi:diaminohydroxyphosphoribosylaminopyrimidine deaminase/5-amino-6-(5-phosphoribosylamino)uracil reductase
MTQQEAWMQRALDLARRGLGRVEPNPMVGALLVRGSRVIAEGYHREYGGRHAEIVVLDRAKTAARGATLVITLEPCSTHGKTPPCCDAIIRAGVRRVLVASRDPNPVHRHRGVAALRRAGIEVVDGVLRREARELLRSFRENLDRPEPFLTAKWAMTLDGQVATRGRASRWISSEASRREGHRERARSDAVLVGIGTVLADDPELTVRSTRGRDPIRLVADGRLRLPPSSRLVRTARDVPVWVVTSKGADRSRERRLVEAGCRVLRFRGRGGRPDLPEALRALKGLGVKRILLEGGPTLMGEAFRAGLVDRVSVFVAGKLFGGDDGLGPVHAAGCLDPGEAIPLVGIRRRSLGGGDVAVEGIVAR